ncbi:ribulose-phosphate 3-epimerase [Candidatus Dependentiae bacterium]|nr:ribulose-phosphate 3-epimerase [Candidatus Dependentiae bacterium]
MVIYPSIISSDLLNIEKEIESLEPYVEGFHIDVMDFHFVQNLTLGPDFVNKIRKITKKKLFVHLMVENPSKFIDLLNLQEQDIISFHIEVEEKLEDVIKQIHEKKLFASLAIKPKTELETVIPYGRKIDHLLLMTVEPGFSGQKFLPESLERIKLLKSLMDINQFSFPIGVDGGINKDNIKELSKLGIHDAAAATAIFKSEDRIKALKELQNL